MQLGSCVSPVGASQVYPKMMGHLTSEMIWLTGLLALGCCGDLSCRTCTRLMARIVSNSICLGGIRYPKSISVKGKSTPFVRIYGNFPASHIGFPKGLCMNLLTCRDSRCIGMVLWTNREEVVPCLQREQLRKAGMAECQLWTQTLNISS